MNHKRSESLRGIGYMVLVMFLFSAVDAQAKYLTQTLPVLQVVWARQFGLGVAVVIALAPRRKLSLRTSSVSLQLLRGALGVASATLFVIAVSFAPLADAVAVAFVAPLAVTALGALFLGEQVGVRRWLAVVVGFIGAMIVVRPGMGLIHPAVSLVLAAAVLFAVRQVLSRKMSETDGALTTLTYTALIGAILMTIPLPVVWETPQSTVEILIMLNMGAWAAFAEFGLIKSLESAEASVVAPFQYTMLIWSTGYGYVLFADLPDVWTVVGGMIVIASGVYTFYRERRVAAARR